MQKSRHGVVQKREEGGEGARPAPKRSIVQRTGKCSTGCSAHVQSLRPIHLCVQFVYLLAQLPRPPPYPLFSFVFSFAKSLDGFLLLAWIRLIGRMFSCFFLFFLFRAKKDREREFELWNSEFLNLSLWIDRKIWERTIFDEKFIRETTTMSRVTLWICREEEVSFRKLFLFSDWKF